MPWSTGKPKTANVLEYANSSNKSEERLIKEVISFLHKKEQTDERTHNTEISITSSLSTQFEREWYLLVWRDKLNVLQQYGWTSRLSY